MARFLETAQFQEVIGERAAAAAQLQAQKARRYLITAIVSPLPIEPPSETLSCSTVPVR